MAPRNSFTRVGLSGPTSVYQHRFSPPLDVVHVLHGCKPPPPRTTIANIPFKSSTYYDARSRWGGATQEQRDDAEGSGKDNLWKDFAVRLSLEKTRLKLARQRVLRRQRTAEA